MEPVLIARENTPMILQLMGQDLQKAMQAFPGESFSEVVNQIYSAHRQLWILPDEAIEGIQAWMLTKIQVGEDGVKRLILDWMGGSKIDDVLPHLVKIEEWALHYGVTEVRALVRPGLTRKLRKQGFRHKCDMVVKPLKGRLH